MQKRKGFTLVELVIVIAVIAILAGVLIGTFASVINRANESARLQAVKAQEIEQKADDILKKIEDSNWYGWEDFEASIVAKLTAAYKASSTGVLTSDEVKAAVTAAMEEFSKEHMTQNTSLTEDQVKAIVENALGTIKYEGISEGQVRAIINEATSNVLKSQLTVTQVKSVVNAANANNLTAAQLSKVLADELSGVVTVTDLDTKLSALTTTLTNTIEATALTEEQVAQLIENLVPVTISVASKTEFETKVGTLNSGSTIVWTGSATETLNVTTSDVKTLTIKGVIGTLNIDAEKATINVLGTVDTLNVVRVASDSLHIYGQVNNANINSGRFVIEAGAQITGILTAAPAENATVTVEIEKNANVNKLVAEYQHHTENTNDRIEIANNGTVGTAELQPVDSDWVPQGSTGANNTTNVRVVNGESAKGTSVSTDPDENEIVPAEGAQITVVEGSDSSTYTSTGTSYAEEIKTELTSFWGELYATSFAGGKGTAVDPYKISNAAELTRLSYLMLEDPDNYKDKYYVLTSDIDLSNSTWMPISSYNRDTGTESKWFAGTFDGNGYSISGLTDDNIGSLVHEGFTGKNKSTVADGGEYSFGLFGSVNGATIKNVNLTDVDIAGATIELYSETYFADSVGALIGVSKGATTVLNVTVTGTIKATDAVAGIIGRIYVGSNAVSIDNCTNGANISGIVVTVGSKKTNALAAGICRAYGVATGGTLTITNCSNTATVTSQDAKQRVGGIAVITAFSGSYDYCTQSSNTDNGKEVALTAIGVSDTKVITAVVEE